jgi:hypothetical protein
MGVVLSPYRIKFYSLLLAVAALGYLLLLLISGEVPLAVLGGTGSKERNPPIVLAVWAPVSPVVGSA